MSDKAYFISDLHLGSAEEPNAFVLLKFLKSIQSRSDATHLFLLGDIFDLWIAGHKYFILKYAPLLNELKRIKDSGVYVHYFEGNHDLYLEHYFGHELGIIVHKSGASMRIAGKNLRIEHGDQMDLNDKGYLFLRSFLRTSIMNWLAPRLPSWMIVRLGEKMSKASRTYTSQTKVISTDRAKKVIYDHAIKCYLQTPIDMHISGHLHVAEDVVLFPQGPHRAGLRVVNLGSWFDEPRVFLLSEKDSGFKKI
jgi:UDP-2,3-diacylglucosamine hydrolase